MTTIETIRSTAAAQLTALASSTDRGFGGPDLLYCMEQCDASAARRVLSATAEQLAPIVLEINDIESRLVGIYSESSDSAHADMFFASRSLR